MPTCNFRLSVIFFLTGLSFSAFGVTPDDATNLRLSGSARPGIFLGVPDPAGMVPSAIMPAVPPTGGQIPAFPYDPINMAKPTFTDAANQYYVDGSNGACDDAAGDGQGTLAIPRCTLPGLSGSSWNLPAGAEVFIAGDGFEYGGGQDVNLVNFPGTETDPIWIVGVVAVASDPRWTNQPKINFGRLRVRDASVMTHTIIDGIHFFSPDDSFRFLLDMSSPTSTGAVSYLTLRHSTCSGSGTSDPSGTIASAARCLSVNGRVGNEARFIVVYDNDLFGLGRWVDDFNTSFDNHAVQPQGATYYFWYLSNRVYHLQGDSIQCSNSNQLDFEVARRPHYIYIADNEMYENYENAYDSKGCYHVVFSENYVHDFRNNVKAANHSPIIINDAESFVGNNFEWFLNNRIENVGDAFSYKGTSSDAFGYFMGNLAVGVFNNHAYPISARCTNLAGGTWTCGDGMFVAMNTIDCGGLVATSNANRNGETAGPLPLEPDGTTGNAAEANQEITFEGNIHLECIDDNGSPHRFESQNNNWIVNYNYNIDYRTSGGISLQASPLIDNQTGNKLNVNPNVENATNTLAGDYRLQNGSQARRFVPEPSPYQLFRDMYGLDIRQDLDGVVWPAGSTLNAGAYQ